MLAKCFLTLLLLALALPNAGCKALGTPVWEQEPTPKVEQAAFTKTEEPKPPPEREVVEPESISLPGPDVPAPKGPAERGLR